MNIGKAVIEYNEDGAVKTASFSTELNIDPGSITGTMDELHHVQGTEEEIKSRATSILASFFSQMTTVELADRTDHPIESNMEACEKYDDGSIKKCTIALTMN